MTSTKSFAAVALVALFSACGPAGKITGKVVIEGGQSGGILVRVLGPTSLGVVTDDTGNFTADKVADGTYQVIAEVPNTDVGTASDTVKVANGTADKQPTLSFKASVGKISGKVAFTDMSDASGITVTLSGTDNRGVQTDSGGGYEFTGLKAGAYIVSVEVPGTRELRQSFSTTTTAMPLPDMVFTWLGTLTGTVKAGTVVAPNATVNIPGTDRFAITDAMGIFTIEGVPTGDVTVMARLNSATATQQVTVKKGLNDPLVFALQTALTGVVQGSIGFYSNVTDTSITVSAAGTTYTTAAAANGDWKLTLPPGTYQIVADARNFPRNVLGLVRVEPGATTTMSTARMSFYKRLNFDAAIQSTQTGVARGTCEGDVEMVAVYFSVGPSPQLWLVDTNLLNRRLLASPADFGTNPVISSKCKWVAFNYGGNVVLHNVTTGEQRYVFLGTSAGYLDFSTDESVLFFSIGNNLHRYTIASGNDDIFTAVDLKPLSRDRILVAGGVVPYSYQLVQPTGATTAAFSNSQPATVIGGAAWALTDCVTTIGTVCTFRVLGTSGTTVSAYNTAQVPSSVTVTANYSTGEYYLMRNGTASVLIKTSNGQGVSMPTSTQWVKYNPAGTRIAYAAPGTAQSLREEALPGTGTVVPVTTTTSTFYEPSGYLSDTRFMTYDNAATPRRIDIKSGTAAIDSDVTTMANGAYFQSGTLATWGKASSSKRIAVLGDGSDQLLDTVPTIIYGGNSTSPLGVSASTYSAPKYGLVSTDGNTTYVIDAVKNELRKLNGFATAGGMPANTFLTVRNVTNETQLFIPAFDQQINLFETLVSPNFPSIQPTVSLTTYARDAQNPRDLLIARLSQQP